MTNYVGTMYYVGLCSHFWVTFIAFSHVESYPENPTSPYIPTLFAIGSTCLTCAAIGGAS